jgi:hypothetical protein
VSGPLWLLRWWQQDSVTNMLAATLAASGTPTPFALEPFDDKSVLVKSDQLGQRIGPGPTKDLRDVRMDYIVATFNGAACGSEPFEVGLKYTGVVTSADKEFNRSFTVTPPAPGHSVRILTPLFNEYGPYWVRADGLLLPPDRAPCLTAMTRAQAPGALPMPFLYATLAEDWRGSPLYQRFRWE